VDGACPFFSGNPLPSMLPLCAALSNYRCDWKLLSSSTAIHSLMCPSLASSRPTFCPVSVCRSFLALLLPFKVSWFGVLHWWNRVELLFSGFCILPFTKNHYLRDLIFSCLSLFSSGCWKDHKAAEIKNNHFHVPTCVICPFRQELLHPLRLAPLKGHFSLYARDLLKDFRVALA